MSLPKQIFSIRQPIVDNVGATVGGGTVEVYATGTTTAVTTYADAAQTTQNASPIPIPASGRVSAWVADDVDVVVKNATGAVVFSETAINPSESVGVVTTLVVNGALTAASSSTNTGALGWVNQNLVGSPTFSLVSQALRFVGNASASGEVVSDNFEANGVDQLVLEFLLTSSIATAAVDAIIDWKDAAGAILSSSTVYSESTNTPTSQARIVVTATPNAGARFASIRFSVTAPGGAGATVEFADILAYRRPIALQASIVPYLTETVTAGRTLSPATVDRAIYTVTAAISLTLNAGTYVAGQYVWLFNNSSGNLTVVYGAGVTVNGSGSPSNLVLATRGVAVLFCGGADTWHQATLA